MFHRLSPRVTGLAATAIILLAGCQTIKPPVPTLIPSATITSTPSPSPSLSVSLTPLPTLAPLITATPAVSQAPQQVVDAPTAVPTLGPYCYVAKAGDNLLSFISRSGYPDLSVLPQTRQLNQMCSTCNNIQAGQTYCVPRQTATPKPAGFEATQTAQASEIPELVVTQKGPDGAIATYTIVKGDTIITLPLKTGASLRELCELNSPDHINCAGCNLDQPFTPGCRPLLREGDTIRYHGPTPTPTVTPTLTGSETATPTPAYGKVQLLAPVDQGSVAGIAQLLWMPIGILQPDEYYLVQVKDASVQKDTQFETQTTSVRLPAEMIPADGQPHTINWRVGVVRKSGDGTYVQISTDMSLIYTFTWQAQ